MATRFAKTLGGIAALGIGLGGFAATSQAAALLIGQHSGTECSGKGGFSNCYANPDGTTSQGSRSGGSPSIFKFNSGGSTEISNLFPTISGSEFTINYLSATNTLTFNYLAGLGDPAIHYFAIKQADGFALYYDAAAITAGTIALTGLFPENPGFSHITFFDTGSTPAVPEPATWALMLAGFGLIGAALRRRQRRHAKVAFAF